MGAMGFDDDQLPLAEERAAAAQAYRPGEAEMLARQDRLIAQERERLEEEASDRVYYQVHTRIGAFRTSVITWLCVTAIVLGSVMLFGSLAWGLFGPQDQLPTALVPTGITGVVILLCGIGSLVERLDRL